jgi:hypothetical protein
MFNRSNDDRHMSFLLSALAWSARDHRSFRINWTSKHMLTTSDSSAGMTTGFRIDAFIEDPKAPISNVTANLTMMGDYSLMSDRFPKYPFYGITFGNQSFFVLVGTLSVGDTVDFEWSRAFFRNKTLAKHGKKLFFNHKTQISHFLSSYPNSHIIFRIITISFRVAANESVRQSSFDSPAFVQGHFFEGKTIKLNIQGSEFAFLRYSQEVRIFGVMMGFCILLALQSWRELRRWTKVGTRGSLISLTTLLLACDYDISSCLVLTFVSDSYCPPSLLFFFLFFAQLGVYMILQFPIIVSVCRQQPLQDRTSIVFITTIGIGSLVIVISARWNYAAIVLFVSAVQWLPQITRALTTPDFSQISLPFVCYITGQRLLASWYCTRYRFNIFEKASTGGFIASSSLLILQAGILTLQHYCGTYFFVPRKLRPRAHDYHSAVGVEGTICTICFSPIEDAREAVVTPCGHPFHYQCLRRAQEKEYYACPTCRNRIPLLSDCPTL